MVVIVLAAVFLRSLGTVVVDDTTEENELPQRISISTCAPCLRLVVLLFPLSTIKIVVVVWQIIYQV